VSVFHGAGGNAPIVLKFGGSVLRDRGSLGPVVHEIHRWRRAGHPVIAVVSAFHGATDALLQAARASRPTARAESVAAVLATGESESAAWLGAALDRAGVPARVLSPEALDLCAEGDALDASPVRFDPSRLLAAFARDEVAVVPGFAARDAAGATCVLGRGGSDLTALFLASGLAGARCHLVKDVDGLYESDPARTGPPPRRFARATWDEVLRLDGTIVQHKAVRFARSSGVEFAVGRLGGCTPTVVGSGPSRLHVPRSAPRALRVALAGCGTVGGGVWKALSALPGEVEVVAVAQRTRARALAAGVPEALLVESPSALFVRNPDVVVECIGGTGVAGDLVMEALQRGVDVVTANKALVAERGGPLREAALRSGARLLASASVGGSTPVLERLAWLPEGSVAAVRGVLNGTCNFVLDAVQMGAGLAEALDAARAAGFAEADVGRDLSGVDAADKLRVIAQSLGVALAEGDVGLEALDAPGLERNRGEVFPLRQVACLRLDGGRPRAYVGLEPVSPRDPLASAIAEENVVEVTLRDGSVRLARGRGAGSGPTAESVVGDVLELARARAPARAAPQST